jgi:hypothetical protein
MTCYVIKDSKGKYFRRTNDNYTFVDSIVSADFYKTFYETCVVISCYFLKNCNSFAVEIKELIWHKLSYLMR